MTKHSSYGISLLDLCNFGHLNSTNIRCNLNSRMNYFPIKRIFVTSNLLLKDLQERTKQELETKTRNSAVMGGKLKIEL